MKRASLAESAVDETNDFYDNNDYYNNTTSNDFRFLFIYNYFIYFVAYLSFDRNLGTKLADQQLAASLEIARRLCARLGRQPAIRGPLFFFRDSPRAADRVPNFGQMNCRIRIR